MRNRVRVMAIGLALSILGTPAIGQDGRAALYEEDERARNLVARITAPTTEGAGILFHIDEHYAYGITAKHVLYQQGKVVKDLRALFQAWPGKQFPVAVHKLHHEADLAVFQADLRSLGLSRQEVLRSIPLDMLGTATNLDPGDELSCMGHSTAGAWITPKEWVRFAKRDPKDGDAFLFEFSCPQGHSGGAVFDKHWRLVGMMIDEERPYCRALAIDPILRIVQGWKLDIDLHSSAPRERGPQKSGEITVAVGVFDNRSGKNFPELGAIAQDAATSFLNTLPGVVLLTRDRLDQVHKEINLPGTAKEGKGISYAGHLKSADALLTGSILRYDVERQVFEGFGTSALQDTFRMEISLQLIKPKTGQVLFSKTFDVERDKQYPQAGSAPGQPIDRKSELLRALLDLAQNDVKNALMQVAASGDKAGRFVSVPVTSSPAGADIIVNGLYMRKTPATLELTQSSHDIEIVLPGYRTWQRRVKVQPGMTIDVHLEAKLR